MSRLCTFDGCLKPYSQNGLCSGHNAQRRRGKPLTPLRRCPPPGGDPIDVKLMNHCEEDENGCWIWQLAKLRGYGIISVYDPETVSAKRQYAHRVAYEAFVGPIPEGCEIDHVYDRGCRSRACINPAHLEAVSRLENLRRVLGVSGSDPSLCLKGHPWTGYVSSKGTRLCLECQRELGRRRYHEAKQQAS